MAKGKPEVAQTQAIQKASPVRALTPFEDMERLMEGFLPHGWLRPFRWEWPARAGPAPMPRIDLVDRDGEFVLRAEIPGVEKKDLDISVTGTTVTLKGQSSHEEKEEKGDYFRQEISHGAFCRTMMLPADVDADKAQASFKDGLLELTLPKVEAAKRRNIKIA
ncbi:MAG: Hsp20/alpha crystallin family protein [Betaproteobacteria bacterium]|nr:Hsp20/alpha crystallin family protein [Betaproteobacteria bacterium]